MNSESGQRLSVEELKRLNQPPTTPVPTTPPSSPMRQDWNDLLAALGALYQLESTNSDRLERLEASVGAQVALLREISAPAGKYPTQAQLEALAQDVAQIREILQPAGKKRGRSFSLPRISLSKISWPNLRVFPWREALLGILILASLAAAGWIFFSRWDMLWSLFKTILPL